MGSCRRRWAWSVALYLCLPMFFSVYRHEKTWIRIYRILNMTILTTLVVFCGVTCMCTTLLQVMAQSVLISNNILHDQENIAIPQQPLIFTCVTRGTGILEWRSPEYIGSGNSLQLLSINCVGRNFSSANNLAIGTCTNVSYDGEIEVIESILYVVASLQHPTSIIICRNNGVGTSMHIGFNTTEPPDVTLTTSLNKDKIAISQQQITFTCVTRRSGILEWHSPEYIGEGSTTIQLLSIDCVGTNVSSSNKLAVATCKAVTYDYGIEVMESELYIKASELFPSSTVTCFNNAHGSSDSIQFQTINEQKPATTAKSVIMTTTDETSNVHTHTYITDITPKKSIGVYAVVISIVIISAIGVAAAMIAFVACKVICKRKG